MTWHRLLARQETNEKYRDRFLETRLHLAECRLSDARLLTRSESAKKQGDELEKAMRELATMARTSGYFDAPAWKQLDSIY